MFLIKRKESGEFLKVSPKSSSTLKLEFDEHNPVYFITESRLLAEKICDQNCCVESFQELAGFDVYAPLNQTWSLNGGILVWNTNILEIVEFQPYNQ